MKKKIEVVLSGANITSGGPLTIFHQCLYKFLEINDQYNVTAFISNKLYYPNISKIKFIEIKWYKRFIPLKLFYEYFYYYLYSKKHNIDIWISISDCNPIVKSKIQVSYFHNALPTHKFNFFEFFYSPKLFIQKYYCLFFFKFNIKSNSFILCQQLWYKNYINKKFGFDKLKIIVYPPILIPVNKIKSKSIPAIKHRFIYPTKAAYYKNIEIILKAFNLLPQEISNNYVFYITVKGNENLYAKMLHRKYKHNLNIVWMGKINATQLNTIYQDCDTLIFPSKLESWGLPISEAIDFNLNIIASDLPYAHETIGNYEKSIVFNPDNEKELSKILTTLIKKEECPYINTNRIKNKKNNFENFNQLLNFLIYYKK